jgi:hypothetical protein
MLNFQARGISATRNDTALIAALRNWQHKGSARGFCAVTSAKEAYASCTTAEIREISCFARSSRDGIRLRSCTKERRSRGDRRRSCDRRGRRRRSRGDRRRSCDRREEERAHDVAISGHQWASVGISGHQMSSAAAHSTHCQMPRPPCNLDRPWARHMAMCPRETRTAPAGFVRSSRTGRWRR